MSAGARHPVAPAGAAAWTRAVLALAILVALVGVGLVAAGSLLPYERVRHWLDRFAADGSADAYTAAVHAGIVHRLRYAGLGIALLGALLVAGRRRLEAGGRALAVSAGRLREDVWRAARRAWTEAPAGHRVALLLVLGAGAATAFLTALLYAPILVRTDVATLVTANHIIALKVRPVPLSEFLAGNADKVADTWRRWASDRAVWLQAVWLAGAAAALVLHRRVGRQRLPLVVGTLLACGTLLLAQRVVPPSRIWVFLQPVFAGMGAAGVLHATRWAAARWTPGRWLPGVTIGLALLLAADAVVGVAARSGAYAYNRPEFPGAEQAIALVRPQLVPGDEILVLGLSQAPFVYYASRQGPAVLRHVYDYLLLGWAPLQSAKRIFVIVNEVALDRPGDTLARVLDEARPEDTPAPRDIASFAGGRVYLLAR